MNILVLLFSLIFLVSTTHAGTNLEDLKKNQQIAGFSTVNIYEDGANKAIGARFISKDHGFVLDLLQIQSVPQGFFWIKTPPKSDQGEPHTCEHLLLGKGSVGKNVAAMEAMSLGNSSAYTDQTITAYHFNTTAGEETFYSVFEAKLNALLHPNFSDEEIRREVCHVGVVADPKDGRLSLEEKGTVYTEMVSAFEKSWYYLSTTMDEMLYGADHPLANVSGGEPSAIREMVPKDMWDFHKQFYKLSNMGIIISIPDNIDINTFLNRVSKTLDKCADDPGGDSHINIATLGINNHDLPDPKETSPNGSIVINGYPSRDPHARGQLQYSWPANLDYGNLEEMVLNLFLGAFANGETSTLYNLFINSKTRQFDQGMNYVHASASSYLGHPISIGMGFSDESYINETMIESLRGTIIEEICTIYDFTDGSEELKRFNEDVRSRLVQIKKNYNRILDSPPMFGFRRGGAGAWLHILQMLENDDGFSKSLIRKEHTDEIDKMLASEDNFWRDYIDHWKLLEVLPYAVGIKPDPQLLQKSISDKASRIDSYIEEYKERYSVDSNIEAITAYKQEFDRNSALIEELSEQQEMPKFIENPPLTLDDQLKYETITLPGGVPFVISTFENMVSSTIGLALRLDVLPESDLMYVPFLPNIMTSIGVIKNGEVIESDKMQFRLREEVLGLNSNFDFGLTTERVELVLRGSGSNQLELLNALEWMEASLYSPYLSMENAPRMLDLIDQRLVELRNTMKRSEEAWVDYPSNAYLFQTNPLFLSANCFLTQVHHLQRLRWQLTDIGDEKNEQMIIEFLGSLSAEGKMLNRNELVLMLESRQKLDNTNPICVTANRVVAELEATLADIPDENLSDDWEYLCNEIEADLLLSPSVALNAYKRILDLISNTDNARMFMVSNSADRISSMLNITNFSERFGLDSSLRISYDSTEHINSRLASRVSDDSKPVYVGLVNDNTRNGLLMLSAQHSEPYDTNAVLDALASQLFSGAGAHGLFMKTWGAGLAYSNGIRFSNQSGRIRYYAERCPDIAETMRFVVNEVKQDISQLSLDEYIVAGSFGRSRAPDRYEARGESMASDLADGITPEVVANYRKKILEIRKSENLSEEVRSRLEGVYGKVLVGYGSSLSDVEKGNYFIIGPEEQFELFENYIASVEQPQKIYRLYPRDFWLPKKDFQKKPILP